jgi:chromosomal replication initiation ATPase DnaA
MNRDQMIERQRAIDITNKVAKALEVNVAELFSKRRSRDATFARHLAMAFIRQHTNMSFPEIGRFFYRDHSTVIYAIHKYPNPDSVLDAILEQKRNTGGGDQLEGLPGGGPRGAD